jgi:hypothetical protein
MANKAHPSAGTKDVAVERINEGLPGLKTVDNPTANPPTRANLDVQGAAHYRRPLPRAVIDTTQTSGLTPDNDLKRGEPNAW